jgi:hypothetical protein
MKIKKILTTQNPPKKVSSKEAIECFSSQSAKSESFENGLDRMTEIRQKFDEIKQEIKCQTKINEIYDFNKI